MSTILQISDLHLLSTPDGTLRGVPTFESARLVMERARREVADPASVVLTGDLSHEHSVAGYRLVEDLLGPWGERSLLIPGNHDDRHGLRTVFAQAPGEGDDDVGFCSHLGNWRLIGLDTQIPDEIPGELSDSMLEQLEAWLTEGAVRPWL